MCLIQGQANHFFRYAPEKIPYAVKRYQTETKRLYSVLESRLSTQKALFSSTSGPWIVGTRLTIADLTCFSWVNWAEWAGVDLDQFPEVKAWADRINAREAVKRGLDVPEKFVMKEKMKSKKGEEEYEKYHSNWVMKGQDEEQKK